MTILAQPETPFMAPVATRISSYLLAEYLERLGVEVIFGLCGHTNIAFLDALGKAAFASSRHGTNRWRRTRPTATRAPQAKLACCSPTSDPA